MRLIPKRRRVLAGKAFRASSAATSSDMRDPDADLRRHLAAYYRLERKAMAANNRADAAMFAARKLRTAADTLNDGVKAALQGIFVIAARTPSGAAVKLRLAGNWEGFTHDKEHQRDNWVRLILDTIHDLERM